MDIEAAKENIKNAEAMVKNKQEYIRKLKQEIAEHLCPFEVGQRVLNADRKEEIVANISYQGWGKGYELKTFKIKKNGEPYQNSSYAFYQDKYTAAD